MQPKVILLWPTHASVWHHDYQHHAHACHNVCFLILLLVQSHEGFGNLGETCKCGVASVVVADDASATAAVIATDADDTVDVAASTAGLSLVTFNKCIRAL